jgi:hypothetical protein
MMLVFVGYDDRLRVRIGKEHLDSFSHGSGYGGTGAIRLLQVNATWFFAYRLDDEGYRGTSQLRADDFANIQSYLPSVRIQHQQLTGIAISEDDLHELFEAVSDDATDLNTLWHPHSKHVFSRLEPGQKP